MIVFSHLLDQSLGLEVSEHTSGNGSVHLELVNNGGNSQCQNLRCLLCDSLVGFLVNEDSIVQLILYLYFSPTLLLWLTALGTLGRSAFLVGSLAFISFAPLGIFFGLKYKVIRKGRKEKNVLPYLNGSLIK